MPERIFGAILGGEHELGGFLNKELGLDAQKLIIIAKNLFGFALSMALNMNAGPGEASTDLASSPVPVEKLGVQVQVEENKPAALSLSFFNTVWYRA